MAHITCCDTCFNKDDKVVKATCHVIVWDKVGSNCETLDKFDTCSDHLPDVVEYCFAEYYNHKDFYRITFEKVGE